METREIIKLGEGNGNAAKRKLSEVDTKVMTSWGHELLATDADLLKIRLREPIWAQNHTYTSHTGVHTHKVYLTCVHIHMCTMHTQHTHIHMLTPCSHSTHTIIYGPHKHLQTHAHHIQTPHSPTIYRDHTHTPHTILHTHTSHKHPHRVGCDPSSLVSILEPGFGNC